MALEGGLGEVVVLEVALARGSGKLVVLEVALAGGSGEAELAVLVEVVV